MSDPQRIHKTVEMYTVMQTVSDDYDCAASILEKYQDSKNEFIHESVAAFLMVISTSKAINTSLVEMLERINKAKKPEDIDETEIAKNIANAKGLQKDAAMLVMAGAKESTFAIVKIEGEGDDAKPVAFTITSKQRDTLLADVRQLAGDTKKKKDGYTYVNGCTDILLGSLTKQFSTSDER